MSSNPEATPRDLTVKRVIGFLAAFGLTLYLTFSGGGYDVIVRAEAGIVVWVVLGLGIGIGAFPRGRLNTCGQVALGGLAALAVLTALSHSWTDSDERTTAELARVLQLLGVVALVLAASNRYTWSGPGAGFAAAALVVPVFSVASRLLPGVFPDDAGALLSTDRLAFPFGYWNAVACSGAMAAAAALAISAHAESLRTRCAALAAVAPALLAVYLSYSRAGVAAAAIAVVAAVALAANRWTTAVHAAGGVAAAALPILLVRSNDEIARGTGTDGAAAVLIALLLASALGAAVAAATPRVGLDELRISRSASMRALAAAGLAALIAMAAIPGPIENGWREFKNERTVSTGDPSARLSSLGGARYVVWTSALEAFERDPSRGIGAGGFEFHWAQEGDADEFVRDAHSLYLEQLAELGVPGALALLAALGGLLAGAIGARRRWTSGRQAGIGTALSAALVVFLFYAGVDWMWEMGAISVLALGGAAAATASGFERTRSRGLSAWWRVALVTACIAAAAAQVPGMVLTDRVRKSDEALAQGRVDESIGLAGDAIDAEPWAASGYAARALANLAARRLDAARADLQSAVRREPTNWRHRLLQAQVEAAAGDRPAFEAALAEAMRLAPRQPLLLPGSPYVAALQVQLSEAERRRGP